MRFLEIGPNDGKSFNKHLNNMNSVVRLKSPHCHHCRNMDNEWNKLKYKDELKKMTDLNVMDLDVDALRDISTPSCMNGLKNRGVPFIFILNKRGNIEQEYNGNRKAEDMVSFILKHLIKNNLNEKTLIKPETDLSKLQIVPFISNKSNRNSKLLNYVKSKTLKELLSIPSNLSSKSRSKTRSKSKRSKSKRSKSRRSKSRSKSKRSKSKRSKSMRSKSRKIKFRTPTPYPNSNVITGRIN